MLELSDQEFKITMIHVLKALMEKANNMEKQIDNFIRQIRKNPMKILEIKNTGTEIKNVINGFISRSDTAEGRISKSVNLKICQKKLPKLKQEKRIKTKTNKTKQME